MLRQKRFYDSRLKWEQFKPGDSVWVYTPQRKPGLSSKLQSWWKGPFQVVKRLSDVTYRVKCGYKCKPQVIHVDRMKSHKIRDNDDNGDMCQSDDNIDEHDDAGYDNRDGPSIIKNIPWPYPMESAASEHLIPTTQSGRQMRRPGWWKDYAF
ncbi:hypothetical protein ACJMK2_016626 [Sinanodonta woodiana]|uniref:Integrase p58-like C-terminal domain-containing protein n=1 Tax=Sinanodonta woodiana TaxID=1069815 RepID=A0ABD3UXS0_SINWO